MCSSSWCPLAMESLRSDELDSALLSAYRDWDSGEPLTKQLLLRKALSLLGFGDIATNTTSQRRALGAALKRVWPQGNLPFVTKTSACAFPAKCHEADDEREELNVDEARAMRDFKEKGVVYLERMVKVKEIVKDVNASLSERPTLLRPSTGNGVNGAYEYFNPEPSSPLWGFLREDLADIFDIDEESRFIILRYAEGGENYLHRDQECPLQATLLLLSRPRIDFNGGNFVFRKGPSASPSASSSRLPLRRPRKNTNPHLKHSLLISTTRDSFFLLATTKSWLAQ